MKKIWFVLILVVLLLTSCGSRGDYYIANESEKCVGVSSGYFEVSPAEFMELFNDRAKAMGFETMSFLEKKQVGVETIIFDPFSGDSTTSGDHLNTMYDYAIGDGSIAVRFITEQAEEVDDYSDIIDPNKESRIDSIIVICEKLEYADRSTKDAVAEYYKIICQMVDPCFDSERFLKKDNSYEQGDLYFHTESHPHSSRDEDGHKMCSFSYGVYIGSDLYEIRGRDGLI